MNPGDTLMAPTEVRPWQSDVLRHRVFSIRRGARMEVIRRPFPTNRGEMVRVRVPFAEMVWRPGWRVPEEHDRRDFYDLLVKTSEVSPAPREETTE
jgi:hypothetical protein